MDRAIQLWSIDWRALGAPVLARLSGLLSAPENAQAARFRRAEDGQRLIAARGLLRCLSGAALGVDGGTLALEQLARGKPVWSGRGAELGFNVSHSGDWILLALAEGLALGVDVQEMRGTRDIEGMARLSMHPREVAHLASLTDMGARRDTFFDLWVLREAALKATGDGFFAERSALDTLPLAGPGDWIRRTYGDGTELRLQLTGAARNYRAALAVAAPPDAADPQIRHFGRDDLPI